MKPTPKAVGLQRRLMDKKLQLWLNFRDELPPPSGWVKAIRGALGISVRQLASIVGVDFSAILQLEKREPHGKVTLALLNKIAEAMNCKVVYAIVPKAPCESLEEIVDNQAREAAKELIDNVEHSMQLEGQGSPHEKEELEKLANELKTKIDTRIWASKVMSKKRSFK